MFLKEELSIKRAKKLFNERQYSEVVEICNQVLNINSHSFEILEILSNCMSVKKKLDLAILYLKKAIKIRPDSEEAIKNLGNLYQLNGDIDQAKYYYLKAIKINPNHAPSLTNLGLIELKLGKFKEALDLQLKATKSDPGLITAWINLSNIYIKLKRLDEAKDCLKRSISLNPDSSNSYFTLVSIFIKENNFDEAEKYLIKIINSNPDSFKANFTLSSILLKQEKFLDAEKYIRRSIEIKQDSAEAFLNKGILLKNIGDLKSAVKALSQSIDLRPKYAEAYSNLGMVYVEIGNLDKAKNMVEKAIKLNPVFAEAYYNLGIIFRLNKELEKASLITRKAISLKPDFSKALLNLSGIILELVQIKQVEFWIKHKTKINSNSLKIFEDLSICIEKHHYQKTQQLKEAEYLCRKVIGISPKSSTAHNNLGISLRELGFLNDSISSFQAAIKLKPGSADIHYNLADTLAEKGMLDSAIESFHQALRYKKDFKKAIWNLSFTQMFQNDYEEGFKNYEARWLKNNAVIPHAQPSLEKWEGEALQPGEPLLVVTEQGLGDTIHFMRYVPYLIQLGIDVSFCAQTQLHGIIQSSNVHSNPLAPREANLISEGKWIPLLSVPRCIGVNAGNPIISKPYLSAPIHLVEKWKNILHDEKKPIIGLTWQGNPKTEIGPCKGRSMPLEMFSKLAQIPNLNFLSLQKGFGAEQLKQCSFQDQFVNCQESINSTSDFLETSAIIENCDLVITTDTCVAHIAAGMGKPTWVLLKAFLTWRYGLSEKTFWYPSMRLFHQKEIGNWQEVLERVEIALKDFI